MKSCLETLLAFLSWIPLYYIFEIDIMENVLTPLIKNVIFCDLAIKCLTEVIILKRLFKLKSNKLVQMIY